MFDLFGIAIWNWMCYSKNSNGPLSSDNKPNNKHNKPYCDYSSLSPAQIRRLPDVRKALHQYRVANPRCEWDNCSNDIEVHHIKPVAIYPELASNTNNMISLGAKRCHLVIGHANNYALFYLENIKEICRLRVIITNNITSITNSSPK